MSHAFELKLIFDNLNCSAFCVLTSIKENIQLSIFNYDTSITRAKGLIEKHELLGYLKEIKEINLHSLDNMS